MPCKILPPNFFPTPPSLPGGIGLPSFTPPIPSGTFCCNFPAPPYGVPPIPLPPFGPLLSAEVAAVVALFSGVGQVFDAVAIPCPNQ
jgi:hypothetical protein